MITSVMTRAEPRRLERGFSRGVHGDYRGAFCSSMTVRIDMRSLLDFWRQTVVESIHIMPHVGAGARTGSFASREPLRGASIDHDQGRPQCWPASAGRTCRELLLVPSVRCGLVSLGGVKFTARVNDIAAMAGDGVLGLIERLHPKSKDILGQLSVVAGGLVGRSIARDQASLTQSDGLLKLIIGGVDHEPAELGDEIGHWAIRLH